MFIYSGLGKLIRFTAFCGYLASIGVSLPTLFTFLCTPQRACCVSLAPIDVRGECGDRRALEALIHDRNRRPF